MIMRITWGKLRPGSWNEFEHTYNATVAVKGRTVKGLRGRWLLQNAANKDRPGSRHYLMSVDAALAANVQPPIGCRSNSIVRTPWSSSRRRT